MFERYTERARQVVSLAQDEARALNHDYVGSEHLLLGLLREGEGVAAKVLTGLGVGEFAVHQDVIRIVGKGKEPTEGQPPFTPRAKKILVRSQLEARFLGQNYIGTEHLLLGLVRENEGVAARILEDALGGDVKEKVMQAVMGRLVGKREDSKHVWTPRGSAGPPPSRVTVAINYDELGNLIGRLLTLNDASARDEVQRKAQRDIIKQTCKDWLEDVAAEQDVEGWT